jgi:hypothetical protein
MDPLSDVLSLLKLRTYMCRGFDIAGPWSIRFGRHDGIKCYAVVSGAVWIVLDDAPRPVRVEAGDCFLMPSGRPFRMTSDPALAPLDAESLFAAGRDGVMNTFNGGGSTRA